MAKLFEYANNGKKQYTDGLERKYYETFLANIIMYINFEIKI